MGGGRGRRPARARPAGLRGRRRTVQGVLHGRGRPASARRRRARSRRLERQAAAAQRKADANAVYRALADLTRREGGGAHAARSTSSTRSRSPGGDRDQIKALDRRAAGAHGGDPAPGCRLRRAAPGRRRAAVRARGRPRHSADAAFAEVYGMPGLRRGALRAARAAATRRRCGSLARAAWPRISSRCTLRGSGPRRAARPGPVGAELPGVRVVGEAAVQRVEQVVAQRRVLDRGDAARRGCRGCAASGRPSR